MTFLIIKKPQLLFQIAADWVEILFKQNHSSLTIIRINPPSPPQHIYNSAVIFQEKKSIWGEIYHGILDTMSSFLAILSIGNLCVEKIIMRYLVTNYEFVSLLPNDAKIKFK